MAEVTKKKSARVERRGRFTITEIEPDSPASSTNGEPHSYDHIGDGDDQHDLEIGNSDDDEAGDGNTRQSFVRDSAAAAALMATERISPFGSAVFERSNGAVRVVGSSDANGESTDSITSGMAVTETGVGDGDATLEHGDRRVKQKGRFTIIELSSDSPRSRRDSAEEFSTTTSISVTSAQVSQANAQNLSTSPTMSGSFASSHGAGSESRGRSAVFSRASSESTPTNSGRMSGSMVAAAAGENNESRGRSGHHRRPSTSRMRSVSPVRGLHDQTSNQNGHDASHPHSASCGSAPFRPQSYSKSPQLRAMHASPAMNGMAATASSMLTAGGVVMVERPHAPLELGSNRRHLASRQKAITISAEQFIQQQQTIASLIRQQQDLKQLIGVLQDQQHHLMSIPLPLNEFKLDQAHSNAQEDTMREVQIQVSTLSRANDALQTLLSQAEHDAHERTMEIECLSDENDEIRHRFSMMEQRYHDERKRSLTLEQELQRTRRALYSARQRNDKSDYNLQKQQYKLSSRTVSRRLEDPIEPEPPIHKTV